MLALAKRSVVEEKIDVLLLIGLGKHGKVRQFSPFKHTNVMVSRLISCSPDTLV